MPHPHGRPSSLDTLSSVIPTAARALETMSPTPGFVRAPRQTWYTTGLAHATDQPQRPQVALSSWQCRGSAGVERVLDIDHLVVRVARADVLPAIQNVVARFPGVALAVREVAK